MTAGKPKARFACDHKRAHSTRAYADAQLRSLVDAGASVGELNVYRCRHCKQFHVGHIRRGYSRP